VDTETYWVKECNSDVIVFLSSYIYSAFVDVLILQLKMQGENNLKFKKILPFS
jgi:hypothetical protein